MPGCTMRALKISTAVELAAWVALIACGFHTVGGILILLTSLTSIRQYFFIRRLEQLNKGEV